MRAPQWFRRLRGWHQPSEVGIVGVCVRIGGLPVKRCRQKPDVRLEPLHLSMGSEMTVQVLAFGEERRVRAEGGANIARDSQYTDGSEFCARVLVLNEGQSFTVTGFDPPTGSVEGGHEGYRFIAVRAQGVLYLKREGLSAHEACRVHGCRSLQVLA